MENIAPLIPAALTAALIAAKLYWRKPLSWPMVLAPLALYLLPLILSLALTVAMLGLILKALAKIPGMKALFGIPAAGIAATAAGAVIWGRKLLAALKQK